MERSTFGLEKCTASGDHTASGDIVGTLMDITVLGLVPQKVSIGLEKVS